jgi:transcriptional regulator with XRE-family HTH domain
LAERLGITYQQVQKYEAGGNRIGAGRLQHIAEVLRVPPPWFFYGAAGERDESDPYAEATTVADDITTWLATDEARDLMQSFSRMRDPQVKRAFVELVEEVARVERSRVEAVPLPDRAQARHERTARH